MGVVEDLRGKLKTGGRKFTRDDMNARWFLRQHSVRAVPVEALAQALRQAQGERVFSESRESRLKASWRGSMIGSSN